MDFVLEETGECGETLKGPCTVFSLECTATTVVRIAEAITGNCPAPL